MKKSAIAVMLALTLSFAAFVAGFYIGRNYNHCDIEIQGIQRATQDPLSESTLPSTHTTVPATLDESTIRLMNAINTATLEQWDEVPDIGEKTAQKILDYRNTYGDFQRPEDLLNVSGIGEKTLEKIINHFRGRLQNEDTGS